MKKTLLFLIFIITTQFSLFGEEIKLEGVFQGENIFVMNPFAATGVGFCIFEVTVNGKVTTDEINSSAFEIDLTVHGLNIGDPVVIIIKHKQGCTPKVLNPEVLKPKSTFEIESITVDKTGILRWTTTNEKGSLAFTVEQFKWEKWVKVSTVNGVGTPGKNSYSCPVELHTGTNKFRVKQVDFSKKSRLSPEATFRNLAAPVTFQPGDGKRAIDDITFSAETSYEIYDYYGKLMMKGRGNKVNILKLDKGQYFINYDNVTQTFLKK
jgi:hypothetical protein